LVARSFTTRDWISLQSGWISPQPFDTLIFFFSYFFFDSGWPPCSTTDRQKRIAEKIAEKENRFPKTETEINRNQTPNQKPSICSDTT